VTRFVPATVSEFSGSRYVIGAAAAFATAFRLARDPLLREDSATREAEALEGAGDPDGCRRAQAFYLEPYPTGADLAVTKVLCVER
jgi:hypothetical protein